MMRPGEVGGRAVVREVPRGTSGAVRAAAPDADSGHAAPQATSRPGRPRAKSSRPALAQERASFGYALQGLRHSWATQGHLRIHAAIAALVVGLGLVLSLTAAEWAALLAMIALVTALELMNTVVEVVVDLVSPDYHPQAKTAKDVAAAAVLVAAAGAVLVGVTVFLPHLWALVRR